MAVTSDQLLINVAVNTEKATASLDMLAKEMGQLRGEFSKTGKETEKSSKALNDFGAANIKVDAILRNVEKSAKLVGKALQFAFGDEFLKEATEQFEKLGAEIGSAINEGLQVDVGKELVGLLKDVTQAFKDVRPAVVDAVERVKEFAFAVRDGLAAIDWGKVSKAIAAVGAAAAVAFAPQIIAAVAAFAAPFVIMALKIAVVAAGLAALASTVVLVVHNFEQLKTILIDGVLYGFVKAKQAALDFGVASIQVLQKVVSKTGELLPAFQNAATSVEKDLGEAMLGFAQSAEDARREAEALGDSMQSAIADIDLSPVTDVIDEAKKGWDAFTGSMEKSAGAAQRVQFGVRMTAKELEEAKKRAEEFKKTQEELAKFITAQQSAQAGVNATEIDQIKQKANEDRAALSVLLAKLATNGKITDEIVKQAEASAALISGTAALAIDKQRLEVVKEIGQRNIELRAIIEASGASELDRLDIELKMSEAALDLQIEKLALNAEENALAIAALEEQKKLMEQITGERKKAAQVEFGDVVKAFKSVKLFEKDGIDQLGKALKLGFDYGATVVKGIAGFISDAVETAFDVLGGAPVDWVADFGEMLAGLPESLLRAFSRLGDLVGRFVQALPQAVQTLVSALPEIVNKIIAALPAIADAIASALPRIAQALADTIPKMIRALLDQAPKIITAIIDAIATLIDAIPAIFDAVVDKLPAIIETFFQQIPKIFISIFKAIPTIVESLLDNIDEIVLAFVQGIIEALDQIVGGFVDEFILGGGLERMIGAILRAIPRIVVALVQGIARGLANAFKRLFGGGGSGSVKMPKVEIDTKQMSKAVKDLGRKLTGEASKLFNVVDLGDQEKGAADKAKEAATAVAEAYDAAIEHVKSWWQKFLDALKAAWLWVYNTLLKPFLDLLKAVWMFVWEKLLKPAWEALKAVWDAVYANIIKPSWDALKAVWQAVYDNIIKPAWDALKLIWDGVLAAWDILLIALKTLWDGVKAIFDAIISSFKALWDGVKIIWDGIIGAFQGIVDIFKGIWDTMKNVVTTAFEGIVDFFKNIFKGNIKEAFEGLWENFKKVGGIIWDGMKAAWDKGVDVLKGLGGKIWEGMKKAFDGAGDALKGLGTKIWDGLKSGLEGAGDVLKGLGTKVWEAIKDGLSGIGDFLSGIFDKLNPLNLFDKIFKIDYKGKGTVEKTLGIDVPYANFAQGGLVPGAAVVPGDSKMNDRILALLSPGEAIVPRSVMQDNGTAKLVRAIIEGKLSVPAFKKGGLLGEVGGSISQGFKDSGAASALSDAGGAISNASKNAGITGKGSILESLDPREMWKLVKDEAYKLVMRAFEANKLHTGGLVRGFANGGEVPAMLQAGEFVMNRGAVSSLGAPFMQALNNGAQPNAAGPTTITVNLDIKTTQPIDDAFFRTRLMPRIKEEIRRAGLDGQRIVPTSGVY